MSLSQGLCVVFVPFADNVAYVVDDIRQTVPESGNDGVEVEDGKNKWSDTRCPQM